jgi:hypothetical protein
MPFRCVSAGADLDQAEILLGQRWLVEMSVARPMGFVARGVSFSEVLRLAMGPDPLHRCFLALLIAPGADAGPLATR